MRPRTKIYLIQAVVMLGLLPLLLWGYATGPDARNTGAPGEPTCAQLGCHSGPGNPTQGSGVAIDFPEGLFYTPGVKQTWTVRVTGAQSAVYGFQVSARLQSNQASGAAGRFTPGSNTFVLCQNNRDRDREGGTCPAATPIEFVQHSLAGNSNSFTFDWTPPATDVGPVRVYAAGNAGNGNGQSDAGDRIFLNNFTLAPKAATLPPPQVRAETPVLQAFSGRPGLSSGTYLEIYGSNFTVNTRTWGGGDFSNNGTQAPTALDGVRVNVNGKPAFVYFISPNQINAQAPDDEALGNVNIEVETASGKSNTATLSKTKVSPALLAPSAFNIGGKQYVVAQHRDQAFVGRTNLIQNLNFRPARPGDIITIFAVGCGPTTPPSPAGQVVPDLRRLASPFQVTFGSTLAQADGFMAPTLVGLCQLNITVPNVTGDATGDIRLDATVDGVATGQTLFTTVQP